LASTDGDIAIYSGTRLTWQSARRAGASQRTGFDRRVRRMWHVNAFARRLWYL